MARTVRDAKLETRTARAALKPSGKPYFRAIDEGLHLGYRKGQAGGKWVVRRYVGDAKYMVESIGPADDTIDADGETILTYHQAQAEARKRFTKAQRAAANLPEVVGPYRVRDALTDYLVWLTENKKTGRNAKHRSDALILPVLGSLPCGKLTTVQIRKWRDDLAATGARIRTKKGAKQRYRSPNEDTALETRRRRSSVNRTLTVLKAALNFAWREKKIASDDAWRPVGAFREVDAARARYLTVSDAQRLINGAEEDFRRLVRAALMTGARFGELAALQVADFLPQNGGMIHVRVSKSGKSRFIVLTEEGHEFFMSIAVGRSGQERLLFKADGSPWRPSHQTRPMKVACERAKIEPGADFHCLRHTYASLTIMNGAPLMVVARNLGHADTRMVDKHYGHLAPSFIADAIRAAAPRFGRVVESNVMAVGVART
jgi:integrase